MLRAYLMVREVLPTSVAPRITSVLKELAGGDEGAARAVRYVGRAPSASPATGQYTVHDMEMKVLITQALEG